MIRYRGNTSSPAIITATAAIISLVRQASELASFLRAMARTSANPHPRRPFVPRFTRWRNSKKNISPQLRSTMVTRRITFEKNISPLDPPRAPATHDGTSAANADLRSRGTKRNPAVLTQKEWDRASAYFRHYLASPPSAAQVAAYEEADRAGVARPIVFDHRRHDQAVRGALTELRTRWGHEQAAVAAEASGSSVAGGAEEPLLSDNVAEGSQCLHYAPFWQPDVADVPLPSMSKRMRAEGSEKIAGDPLEWHCIGKRQKTEPSAVADKESSAVADGVATKAHKWLAKAGLLACKSWIACFS